MSDRHKVKPMSLRLPEDLRQWVEHEAERTGKPVRRVILEAIEAARDRAAR
jgi:predicted DNA-binding protein